jgi:hypothetical protein
MTADETFARVAIDKQHPLVYRAQIEVAKAVRKATQEAGLDRALVELVNIRVSQIGVNRSDGSCPLLAASIRRTAWAPGGRRQDTWSPLEQCRSSMGLNVPVPGVPQREVTALSARS